MALGAGRGIIARSELLHRWLSPRKIGPADESRPRRGHHDQHKMF